jgi:hypothetical protein
MRLSPFQKAKFDCLQSQIDFIQHPGLLDKH